MKIRAITVFADVSYPVDPQTIADAGKLLKAAEESLTESGFEVQTTRFATQPFEKILAEAGPGKAVELAKDLEAMAFVHEIGYLAMGALGLEAAPAYVEAIPDVLNATESLFTSVEIANPRIGLRLPRARRMAEVIGRAAQLTDDGFSNLRLAAIANVPAWGPFFPSAYHGGGPMAIALATESADLAVEAVTGATSLEAARETLIKRVENEARRLESTMKNVSSRFNATFKGIDFSLAPYPEEARSIGTVLEKLGLPAAGSQGTVLAAAFLTDALDRAKFMRTGFCGLFLTVLEDSVLSNAAANGQLRLSDLLLASTVCGSGLDTVPLPGDISIDSLEAILLDVAALALRLDKPLTARLMPVPGKQAGDAIEFDFEFFAASRIMAPHGDALSGLLSGNEDIEIRPYHQTR